MFDDLTLEGWIRRLDEERIRWDYTMETMVALHEALHRVFGDDPNEAIIPGEQRLSLALSDRGLPHRKDDALSRAAGTYRENPPPPDVYEFMWYLELPIVLATGATQLWTDASAPSEVYLHVDDTLLPGMSGPITKALNRKLPPELKLKPPSKNWKADFVQMLALHDICLSKSYSSPRVALWETIKTQIRKEASEASSVFKIDQDPQLHPQVVLKQAVDEDSSLFVLGLVLRPGVIDRTQVVLKDGQKTDGDIASEEDVEKACHWFAANSGRFSLGHIMLGGKPMGVDDVHMVENYIYRGPDWDAGNGHVIMKGDWLTGARAYSQEAKVAFQDGTASAWSIGAYMAYELLEVPVV